MKNKFFARFDSDNLRKTLIYLVIAALLIIVSFFTGFTKSSNFAVISFFIGCVMFFYAALHPWEKVIYYFIMLVISVILLILLFKVGIGILVKIESRMQIPGHWAEGMAWTIGGVCVAAIIAGIIGMVMFRKDD